jgi:DNA-binding IclR family transcriptional regulator
MIKVVKKVFDILEYIADKKSEPPLLGEMAKDLDLAQPTCSRIIKDLIELGYVESLGQKRGFALGPKSYQLSQGRSYREDLNAVGEPEVKKLSELIKESVLLAVFNKGKRYILCHHNGNPEIQVIIDKPYYEDIYTTATGRLLLAYAGEKGIQEYVKQYGLPDEKKWKDINSKSVLLGELDKIREDGMVLDDSRAGFLSIVAFPVWQKENMIAALGVSVPKMNFTGKHKEFVLNETKKSAENITSYLN